MNLLVLCPHFAPDWRPTGEVVTASPPSSSRVATDCTS